VGFDNWRRVEGLLWLGQITRWTGGRLNWQIEGKDIELNRALPDVLFQKP
jgi:hypothetical protein